MGVLKIKISGQRVKYETAKVTFAESDLLRARSWKWDDKKNSYYSNDNKLDIIRDHKDFDYVNAGVAIHPSSSVIYYEMGNTKGRTPMHNMLTSINHPILVAIRYANDGEGLTQTSANVYDSKNTIYLYSVEVRGSEAFDPSLLEIICIKCPVTDQEHIVELRYDGKKMEGGAEGLSYSGEPVSQTQMLSMSKEYADALGLAENKRLVNILGFDDFIREENRKDGKRHKVSEDYIHSFIAEHERDYEPEEE
jgi:hypothetical protein